MFTRRPPMSSATCSGRASITCLSPTTRVLSWGWSARATCCATCTDTRRPPVPGTVMVPLDGSPAAEAALPWAIQLAKRCGGDVRLVGVHAPPAVVLDGETLGTVIPDEPIRQKETDYFAG